MLTSPKYCETIRFLTEVLCVYNFCYSFYMFYILHSLNSIRFLQPVPDSQKYCSTCWIMILYWTFSKVDFFRKLTCIWTGLEMSQSMCLRGLYWVRCSKFDLNLSLLKWKWSTCFSLTCFPFKHFPYLLVVICDVQLWSDLCGRNIHAM
jgi:hypothetical protein